MPADPYARKVPPAACPILEPAIAIDATLRGQDCPIINLDIVSPRSAAHDHLRYVAVANSDVGTDALHRFGNPPGPEDAAKPRPSPPLTPPPRPPLPAPPPPDVAGSPLVPANLQVGAGDGAGVVCGLPERRQLDEVAQEPNIGGDAAQLETVEREAEASARLLAVIAMASLASIES